MKKRKLGYTTRGWRIGETHHSARLTDHEVNLMREMFEAGGMTIYRLAKIFEISRSHCYNIVRYNKRVGTAEEWHERKYIRRFRAKKPKKKK